MAVVPFARNIAEFTDRKEVEDALTHLKLSDLQSEMEKVMSFPDGFALPNRDRKFSDVLSERAAAACALSDEEVELESKIVLAIAIRIEAERFMLAHIADAAAVAAISKNQTSELFKLFKLEHGDRKAALSALKQVNLMTPENIHINSFMFEPILDMSNLHLCKLYKRVCSLKLE